MTTLLQAPRSISPAEIDHIEKTFDATFYNETHAYNLRYRNGTIGFSLAYKDNLPETLTEEEKSKFIPMHERQENEKLTYYLYETGATRNYFTYSTLGFPANYHVAPPRVTQADTTTIARLSVEKLISFLQTKRVVFYTGAGISIASGVPHMQQFMDSLGIDKKLIVDKFIRTILHTPGEVTNIFRDFCNTLFENNPNKAHYALTSLALQKNSAIITENIDILHERTGYLPYHTEGANLPEDIDPSEFLDVDAFICIGLRYDDRGLLAWYKQHNQTGKIIAIDLQCPAYLGEEDYLVLGDVQYILPEIEQHIVNS